MKNSAILISILIFTISCNSKKNTTETPKQNIHRVWMLVEFKDFKKEYFIEKKANLDLTNKTNANAKMGCNSMSFPYHIKNNSEIVFSNGIATQMYCEDMKLEDEFSRAITQNLTYSISGHQLTLTSKNGVKMVFIAQDWD